MATANSNINITELDFDTIKNTLKTYLSDKPQFKDYNFEGSTISTLLDVLAYNTHYNAFYLNMVSNEMFLDSALKRSSVISQAKLLNYTPRSSICSQANVSLSFYSVSSPTNTITIPKYSKFYCESVDGINYPFCTLSSSTLTISQNSTASANVTLYQGQPLSYTFFADTTTNPKSIFKLPDSNIDLSTLLVRVYQNNQTTAFDVFEKADSYLTVDKTSPVYFIQESLDGYYELYFGDGILGKALQSQNKIVVEYLSTKGSTPNGVKHFTMVDKVNGSYSSVVITTNSAADGGKERETIDQIKFHAPKSFAAQGRAVTKEDYITLIQQNKYGYSFDSVSVWGGEENSPPVYGQVFIALKPTGGYVITDTQKQRLINDVIKPVSVMTVEPTIVDPDYTYIKLDIDVLYDPKLTLLTADQLRSAIVSLVTTFGNSTLNTFNSTFRLSELISLIDSADKSIITNNISVKLQKKFFPNLTVPTSYNLYYRTPLRRGLFSEGVTSSPSMQFRDKINLSTIIDGVKLEEVPIQSVGVESISILNPGFSYQYAPTVTIVGDGSGATAEAILSATGSIKSINVLTKGSGYTSAIVKITPAVGDTTGKLGAAFPQLEGRYGTLRLYYNNTDQAKTIYNQNIGVVDYSSGVVTLNSFNPIGITDPLGQLVVSVNPLTTIFSSTYNSIITIDQFDPTAINVNIIEKT